MNLLFRSTLDMISFNCKCTNQSYHPHIYKRVFFFFVFDSFFLGGGWGLESKDAWDKSVILKQKQ